MNLRLTLVLFAALLSLPSAVFAQPQPARFALGDVTGDGVGDFVGHTTEGVEVFSGGAGALSATPVSLRPDGAWSARAMPLFQDAAQSVHLTDVISADLDGDGQRFESRAVVCGCDTDGAAEVITTASARPNTVVRWDFHRLTAAPTERAVAIAQQGILYGEGPSLSCGHDVTRDGTPDLVQREPGPGTLGGGRAAVRPWRSRGA